MQRQGSVVGGSVPPRLRVIGCVLLTAHLALVAWLTLRPLDVPWVLPANLRPLDGVRADLALGWPEAARPLGEGLALLAPLGVLLPLAHGRLDASPPGSLLRTVGAGALLSLAIELLQSGVPGRVVDMGSLPPNIAGVALAHLAVVPFARSRLRRRASPLRREGPGGRVPSGEAAQGRTPTIPRVRITP
ncbi:MULTISPECIES: VanZ family protein [unclassified Streptomyces]|uniref:VanZ family protein n=1 Tax=unclassified Streptomyces TaxID=2593676 RepID=UPI0019048FBB|nr:VanZ family protein [Streptomyces sp. HSG2]